MSSDEYGFGYEKPTLTESRLQREIDSLKGNNQRLETQLKEALKDKKYYREMCEKLNQKLL